MSMVLYAVVPQDLQVKVNTLHYAHSRMRVNSVFLLT